MHPIIQNKLVELRQLCVRYRVNQLALFGSATTDRFDPASSDVDFLVEFDSMAPAEHADCYFGLTEDLEHLFGMPVDLIEPQAIRNPYFRKKIDESRMVVYEAA